MCFLRALLASTIALAAFPAAAANLPLLSGSQYSEPSQMLATVNTVIQNINSGVGGLANAQTGSVGNTSTSETILEQWAVPANTLNAAGQSLRITCWGTTAANSNNKTIKLYFGASVITSGTLTDSNKNWTAQLIVMRTGAATQSVIGTMQHDTTMITPYYAAGTDDLTADVTAKCTGQSGTASNDIVAKGMIVELIK
jgi:hypothetical protein